LLASYFRNCSYTITAIVAAEVETDRGGFSGIGDASPANVARAMLTATIRLASTRAKAWALRDAINVGVAALEEWGNTSEPEQTTDTTSPPMRHPHQRAAQGPGSDAVRKGDCGVASLGLSILHYPRARPGGLH